MLKAFAMRLMHIGLKVHVVGDVVTPALQKVTCCCWPAHRVKRLRW